MKYILTMVLFGILAWNVQAGEFNASVGQRSMNAGNDGFTVEDWNFIEITYKPENSNFYYGISQEEAEVAPISYLAWTYSIKGLLIGTDYQVNKNISIFGHLGYYFISNNLSGINESLDYYFNTKFYGLGNQNGFHAFGNASLKNSDSFGGTLGIKITQPIGENVKIGFSISHRLLKIKEILDVRFAQNNDWIWRVSSNRDYSSTSFGLNATYAF